MLRKPPDILITTPESLYLLLTSQAREMLRSVETVIVDEVHAVAGTKRGAHLALSLERLERLPARPAQRIGLSATQRPIEEIGRFVSGGAPDRARRRGPGEGARPRGRRARSRTCARPGGSRSTAEIADLLRHGQRGRDGARSGRRSTRRSCGSSSSTGRRSSSSTTGGSPSGWRCASTSSPSGRSHAPTTARSPASSGSRSRSC